MSTVVHNPAAAPAELVYACSVCERPLEAVEFSGGGCWSVRGLLMRGRRKFKSALCFDCYVAASRSVRGAVSRRAGDA